MTREKLIEAITEMNGSELDIFGRGLVFVLDDTYSDRFMKDFTETAEANRGKGQGAILRLLERYEAEKAAAAE